MVLWVGQRSPLSPRLQFTGLQSSFHRCSYLPRMSALSWPLIPRNLKPPLLPSQRSNHGNSSFLDYFLIDFNFILQYLFWIISVLNHSSHSRSSDLSVCLTVEVHLCRDYLHCCEDSRGRLPRCLRSRSSEHQGSYTRPFCVSRFRPALPLTHTMDG